MLQKFDPRNRDLIVNINGKLVHRDEAGVSPFDSAVQGGDAVWEGLRLYRGRIFRLEEHLDRLVGSAKALAFQTIPPRDAIVNEIRRTFAAETNATHVFLVVGGVVQTSRLVACPEGITRSVVLELCRKHGVPSVETDLSLTDVYRADEMFCTGTMGELAPVVRVDGRV